MVGWEGGNGERKGVVDGERRFSCEKEREKEGCLPGGKEGAREVDTNASTKAKNATKRLGRRRPEDLGE